MVDGNSPASDAKFFRKGTLKRTVGANLLVYKGVRNVRLREGNTIDKETVIDTDIRKTVTSYYDGTISGEFISSSSDEIYGMATSIDGAGVVTYGTARIIDPDATTGELPEVTFKLINTEKDNASNIKTHTVVAKLENIEYMKEGERGFHHWTFSGVLTARVTVA